MKPCGNPLCRRPAVPGERYCKTCRADVLRGLVERRYLTMLPETDRYRPANAREKVNETKHGVDR